MKLMLYHKPYCPFCTDVEKAIERLGVPGVEFRDIAVKPEYAQELVKTTGIRQVPCLVADGKPMLESREIIQFLEKEFGNKG